MKTLTTSQSAREACCYTITRLNSFTHFRRPSTTRSFHAGSRKCQQQKHPEAHALDPRLEQFGYVIQDEYSVIRENYGQLFLCV